jgi:hypothetical protein
VAFDRPVSAAIFIVVIGHVIVYGPFLPAVRDLVAVLLLVPAIRLTTLGGSLGYARRASDQDS